MDEKINIIADCDIPYLKGVLEPYAHIQYIKGSEICHCDLSNTQVLIVRTRTICNKELLKNSNIKLILTATIGFDHIDTNYCTQAGITVKTAAGCNARGVLQWVSATLCLDASKRDWQPNQKTLGVVGVGNVGSLVAYYANLWGFKVMCCDPYKSNKNYVNIEQIYKSCDIITFHVPCTPLGDYPTFHMFNSKACEQIKAGCLIMNASRGEVFNTQQVKQYTDKFIFAIDTWEKEPDLDLEFMSKTLVSTPHIAGYSSQGKANGTSMVVNQLAEIFDLPLKDWYPNEVEKTKIRDISWEELNQEIDAFYNIQQESNFMRKNSKNFEQMRNNYTFRQEFF